MIINPKTDLECLQAVTDYARTLVAGRDPQLLELAKRLRTAARVKRWMGTLPQRDDSGRPEDEPHQPRIYECEPPQRVRILAPDPNCLERALLYLVLCEFLDPGPERYLHTIETARGLHTLPIENGAAIVLDPRVSRNSAQAGADLLGAGTLPAELDGCVSWVCRVAAEPAERLPGGLRRVRNARAVLQGVACGHGVAPEATDDVALTLALAAREAAQWGPAGTRVVDRVAQTVIDRHQPARNAVELKLGRYRIRPTLPKGLTAALRALGVVGLNVGAAAARAKLATLGISPAMLGILEEELNKDGLTIGTLGKPPPPALSIASLSKDALVARHLERVGAA